MDSNAPKELYADDKHNKVWSALRAIVVERAEQISKHGFTTEHDDQHSNGELFLAAACYMQCAVGRPELAATDWPFTSPFKAPASEREALVKAAAMLAAEIERLDRLAEKQSQSAE